MSEREADRQTQRQTERQRDRQRDREINLFVSFTSNHLNQPYSTLLTGVLISAGLALYTTYEVDDPELMRVAYDSHCFPVVDTPWVMFGVIAVGVVLPFLGTCVRMLSSNITLQRHRPVLCLCFLFSWIFSQITPITLITGIIPNHLIYEEANVSHPLSSLCVSLSPS